MVSVSMSWILITSWPVFTVFTHRYRPGHLRGTGQPARAGLGQLARPSLEPRTLDALGSGCENAKASRGEAAHPGNSRSSDDRTTIAVFHSPQLFFSPPP